MENESRIWLRKWREDSSAIPYFGGFGKTYRSSILSIIKRHICWVLCICMRMLHSKHYFCVRNRNLGLSRRQRLIVKIIKWISFRSILDLSSRTNHVPNLCMERKYRNLATWLENTCYFYFFTYFTQLTGRWIENSDSYYLNKNQPTTQLLLAIHIHPLETQTNHIAERGQNKWLKLIIKLNLFKTKPKPSPWKTI